MDTRILVSNVLWILCTLASVSAKQCVKYNNCACVFDDGGGMIDLSPIGHADGTSVFADHPTSSSSDSNWYSYNPCGTFNEVSCVNVAICQYDPGNYVFHDVGVPEKVAFNYDGISVVVQYQSEDGTRNTFVTLVCNPGATEPSLDVEGEKTPKNYYMTLTSVAACPVSTPYEPTKQGDERLSTGSILLIIFFVLLFVYLVIGITFNKVWRDSSGIEIIPNIGFWKDLAELVRDGCALSMATVCRKRTVYVTM